MIIADFVKQAIGVPFKPHCYDYNGWDCWGLVVMAYQELYNIDLPRYNKQYNNIEEKIQLFKLFDNGKKEQWVQIDVPIPGDVVIVYQSGIPIHIGLVYNKDKILHVKKGVETCLQRIKDFRIEGFYRYAKFAK